MRFDSIETRDAVMQRGFYHFDKKPFIVKPGYEGIQKKRVEHVPVWVQFPKLDLRYWSLTALSKLASLLGMPIMANKNTVEKNMVPYARVLIEMPTMDSLPKHILFEDETSLIQQQEIIFEWRPMQCAKCKNYGHETEHCKKQEGIMIWRPKQTQKVQEPTNQNQSSE